MPPLETPVAIVAAVEQVQQHPLPSRVTGSTRTMLDAIRFYHLLMRNLAG